MYDFFEFSNEMLCVADDRGYFIRVNPAWTKTLGWSAQELMSRPFVDFVHPDDVAATLRESQLLLSGQHETILFENRYRCRDGTYRWISWQAKFAPGSKHLVATARDVTEQKRQAEVLREALEQTRQSEAHLLLALEAGRLGTWSWDVQTNHVQTSVTQAMLHGRSPQQTSTTLDQVITEIHPEDRALIQQTLEQVLGNRAPERITYRVVWPDGSIHWLDAVGQVICDATGTPRQVMGVCADITERKRTETALRESEERFRLLAMHAPVGIAQCDAAGRTFFVNAKWCEISGADAGCSMDFGWHEFLHPDDRSRLLESWLAQLAAGKGDWSADFRFVRNDGTIRWLSGRASLVLDAAGNPTGQIVVLDDITVQRQVELALQASQERFRVLATHAPVGIFQADEQGRNTFANQRWTEMTGLSAEETRGTGWRQSIHPDDLAELDAKWQASVQASREYSNEFRIVHKDGSIRWVTATSTAILDPNLNVVSHIGTVIDVTTRKNAESKLQLRESQLTGILDNAPAVIYLKDAEGRYLLANQRHRSLFRALGDSIVGKTDPEFFPAEIARVFLASDAKVWNTQEAQHSEEVAPHADGLHTYRSVKFPVRDVHGKMIALGGISTDVSDLKAAFDALTQERQLLRNLIEVQEGERRFLCHEFHDGVIQYAVAALMDLEALRDHYDPAPEFAAAIDTVLANLRRGVEDGRRVIRGIRPAVLDDSEVAAAIDDLVGQYSTSGILVTSKCDPQIGRLPNSIQTTIYRVVQEALNNARKHSGTDVVRIELEKVGNDLHLEVRDFGVGFDVDIARREGFGLLGMTERVRLLGGECQIQSEADSGTRIHIRLPIAPASGC